MHSTPENYFKEVEAKSEYTKSLQPFSIGCYSSMSQVKQRVAKLESELVYVEKMYSVLSLKGKCEYPQKEIDEVSYDLLYAHFHDIFTGTSIKDAEIAAIRMLDHGLEILAHLKAKALFKLSYDYKKATPLADSIGWKRLLMKHFLAILTDILVMKIQVQWLLGIYLLVWGIIHFVQEAVNM